MPSTHAARRGRPASDGLEGAHGGGGVRRSAVARSGGGRRSRHPSRLLPRPPVDTTTPGGPAPATASASSPPRPRTRRVQSSAPVGGAAERARSRGRAGARQRRPDSAGADGGTAPASAAAPEGSPRIVSAEEPMRRPSLIGGRMRRPSAAASDGELDEEDERYADEDGISSGSDSDTTDDDLADYDLHAPPRGYDAARDPYLAVFGRSLGDANGSDDDDDAARKPAIGESRRTSAPVMRERPPRKRRGSNAGWSDSESDSDDGGHGRRPPMRRPKTGGAKPAPTGVVQSADGAHDMRPTLSKLSLFREGSSRHSIDGRSRGASRASANGDKEEEEETAAAAAGATPQRRVRKQLKDFKFPSLRRAKTVDTDRAHVNNMDGFRRVNQYLVLQKLGRGAFGVVRLVYNTRNGRYYAMKILNKARLQRRRALAGHGRSASVVSREWEAVKQEIALSKRLGHPHVVRLMEVIDDQNKEQLFLIQELVAGGTVMPAYEDWRALREEDARRYFRDLAEGLMYLHSQGVAHRDIKPDNLLVTLAGRVKISDFGVATAFASSRGVLLETGAGTTPFMAPEMFSDKYGAPRGTAVDVWAAGVTLYAMAYGKLPFRGADKFRTEHKIREKKVPLSRFSRSKLVSLLRGLLEKDPAKRLTLEQALEHPWMLEGEA